MVIVRPPMAPQRDNGWVDRHFHTPVVVLDPDLKWCSQFDWSAHFREDRGKQPKRRHRANPGGPFRLIDLW
jgi:hypothetical protein